MLELRDVNAGYEGKQVLFSVSLEVRANQVVSLIGPNGAGKSTVLKAVAGVLPIWGGDVLVEGTRTNGFTPAQNVRGGVSMTPQDNRVFRNLTVKDNLRMGGYLQSSREVGKQVEDVWLLFPELKDLANQIAGKLSGGEQQMVAFARALIQKPKLLLLDEPSLGLAPKLAAKVLSKVREICSSRGVSVLVVEQRVQDVLGISHRVCAMRLGRVSFQGDPDELRGNREKLRELFL